MGAQQLPRNLPKPRVTVASAKHKAKLRLEQQAAAKSEAADSLALAPEPEQAPPEQAVPEKAAPNQTVPELAAPERAVPEQTVPERAAAAAPAPGALTNLEAVMVANASLPPSCQAPDHLMVLNSVLFFEVAPSKEEVELHLQKLLYFVRFRSVLRPSGEVELCDVDVRDHVRVLDADLGPEAAVARVAQEALDPARPLWEAVLVPAARLLVLRVHHGIGDGFALASVCEQLLTDPAGRNIPPFAGATKLLAAAPKAPGKRAKLARGFANCCYGVAVGCDAVASSVRVLAMPGRRLETDHAFCPRAPKVGGLVYSGRREVLMLPRVQLEFVKRLKSAAGCSVNDVLMGCFAGAVREYCLASSDAFAKDQAPLVRTCVPFGAPPDGEVGPDGLRNKFALVSVPLAVGPEPGPAPVRARVRSTQRSMAKYKRSTLPAVARWMVERAGCLPLAARQRIGRGLYKRHSLVFSNVPGPQETAYFAGKAVTEVQCAFLGPIPTAILISYAGGVGLTLSFDPGVLSEPEVFAEQYRAQFLALADELGVCPDGAFK